MWVYSQTLDFSLSAYAMHRRAVGLVDGAMREQQSTPRPVSSME